MKVISVEIFVRSRCGEEEIEKFENEQLEGSLAFSVQEEDNVLAESFIGGPLRGKNLHDFVSQRRTWASVLIGARVVSGAHVLFVQNELSRLAKLSLPSSPGPTYYDSYNRIVIWIVHIVG